MKTDKYVINISKVADRFLELENGKIVEVKNFCHYGNTIVLLGYEFKRNGDLYTKPCQSTLFDIAYIRKINTSLQMWNIDAINKKLVVLVHEGRYVSFPMLHV